jgi:hypothetical protein
MLHPSTQSAESTKSAFIRDAQAFLHLTSTDDIFDAYLGLQESLLEVIESAPDPSLYSHVWYLLSLAGQRDLLDYQQGRQEALLRLKQKVSQGIELFA